MVVGEKVLKIWKAEIVQIKKDYLLKKDLKVAKILPTKKPTKKQ